MKPIERNEILGLGEYEQIRERFRDRIIAEKRSRRVRVGDFVSAVFENRDTALFQIQEMLRTERITQEKAIAHELETYNQLVPGENELSATMFVEVLDRAERDRLLADLAGLEGHIALEIGGELVRARNETRGTLPDRTTAVHYLKFPIGPYLAARLREQREATPVAWVLDHPKLSLRTELTTAVVASLVADLA